MSSERPLSRLTLGTAQFGAAYGIANDIGCPSDGELKAILDTACQAGISYLDTARAYGNAEARLGRLIAAEEKRSWGIITKIAPLGSLMKTNGITVAAEAAALSLKHSCASLRVDNVDILMFHRSEDMLRPGVMERLEKKRAGGRFRALGVSVYEPYEGVRCLADPRIRHLQIPLNLLDRRWLGGAFERALAKRRDVTVHVRGAFLQGLLLHEPERWPSWVDGAREIGSILTRAEAGLAGGRIELCLRYLASVPWLTTVVIGVDSAAQLRKIVSTSASKPLSTPIMAELDSAAALAPARLLNPSLW